MNNDEMKEKLLDLFYISDYWTIGSGMFGMGFFAMFGGLSLAKDDILAAIVCFIGSILLGVITLLYVREAIRCHQIEVLLAWQRKLQEAIDEQNPHQD